MQRPAGPLVKALILTLASAQLAMSVLGPLHEATAASDHGPSRVEQAQAPGSRPVHNADNCPVCQYLAGHLLVPDEQAVPLVQEVEHPIVATPLGLLPARAPPTAHQTRAPPITLV
jgi:hypothetical protein